MINRLCNENIKSFKSSEFDMHKILIFILLALISFNSFSQTYWKIENENGDEILLTLHVNDTKKTFEAYTRKDALKDLAGIFAYTLAKAAGKLKYPEIVFIEGKTQNKNDSLQLTGTFNYFDKQFLFSATISENHFIGKYLDTKNRPHQLTGIKVPTDKPIKDYTSIINSAFIATEKNIFNAAWLKSGEWQNFRKKVNELKAKIADDYELAATFYWLGKVLPFSPYEIRKMTPRNKSSNRRDEVTIREIEGRTAVFDANRLPGNQKEMDSVALIIAKKGYSNLIIDLRGRTNINPCTANIFVNYLSDKSFNAGIYLTRKWVESNNSIPKVQDYKKTFKSFSNPGYQVGEFYKEAGRLIDIVPVKIPFIGKVYVLTDSRTSRASEAMVYILKNENIATIVGQRTAGASMLAEHIRISNDYDINLPVSEYYTNEGKSLGRLGIEPDIKVPGEDAMRYILKIL